MGPSVCSSLAQGYSLKQPALDSFVFLHNRSQVLSFDSGRNAWIGYGICFLFLGVTLSVMERQSL
jgi:hypothetical protein